MRLAKPIQETENTAVCKYFLNFHSPNGTDAERKGERIRLRLLGLLERPQRFTQNSAIDFNPAVAEEDESRILLKEKAYLLGANFLACDLDLKTDAFLFVIARRICRVAIYLGNCGNSRREIHARHGIARVRELARATPNKVFCLAF